MCLQSYYRKLSWKSGGRGLYTNFEEVEWGEGIWNWYQKYIHIFNFTEVFCSSYFKNLQYSFPVSYNRQTLHEVCIAPFNTCRRKKTCRFITRAPLRTWCLARFHLSLPKLDPSVNEEVRSCFIILRLEEMLCSGCPPPNSGSQGPDCPLVDVFPLRVLLEASLNPLVSKFSVPCAENRNPFILNLLYSLPFCAWSWDVAVALALALRLPPAFVACGKLRGLSVVTALVLNYIALVVVLALIESGFRAGIWTEP